MSRDESEFWQVNIGPNPKPVEINERIYIYFSGLWIGGHSEGIYGLKICYTDQLKSASPINNIHPFHCRLQ